MVIVKSQNLPESSHNLPQLPGEDTFETLHLPTDLRGNAWLLQGNEPILVQHRHAELEFNLGLAGRASYAVSGRRVPVGPRTLIWIYPGQDHVLLDRTPDFSMWVGVFTPELLKDVCQTARYNHLKEQHPTGEWFRRITRESCLSLEALCQEVVDGRPNPDLTNSTLAYLLLKAQSSFEMGENLGPACHVHPAVQDAARLLRDAFPPPSVPELGRMVGLSPSRLSRLFKAQTGVGLVEFRQRQCLARCLSQLEMGPDQNLNLLAERAGFKSYSQFHRVFWAQMHMSPAQWLKRRRAEQNSIHATRS